VPVADLQTGDRIYFALTVAALEEVVEREIPTTGPRRPITESYGKARKAST
jgi:hypothetical protein